MAFLGRFITPDSIVQAPADPQSLNRYSYCRNNPLKYIDPTGHSWWSKLWKSIVGGLVGGAVGFLSGQPWLGMAAYNGVMTALEGGNYAAAIGGGLSGYAWGAGVTKLFGNFWGTLAAGVMSGVDSARIAGGDVGKAALAGFAGSLTGYGVGAATGFAGLGTIMGGGVASEVGGGSFADGALGGLGYNIGYTVGSSFGAGLTPVDQANVESGDQVFFAKGRLGKGADNWASRCLGWAVSAGMAILDPGPFHHTGIGVGNGQIADSHPDVGSKSGPGIRNLTGDNQFSVYEGEKIATVKHNKALGVAAQTVVTKLDQAGVDFGGGIFGGPENAMFCSQFTGEVYRTSGETGVYGYGPNTQYWFTK